MIFIYIMGAISIGCALLNLFGETEEGKKYKEQHNNEK